MSEFFSTTIPVIDQEVKFLTKEDDQRNAGLLIHALKKSDIANDVVYLSDGTQTLDFISGTVSNAVKYMFANAILIDFKNRTINTKQVFTVMSDAAPKVI